MSNTGLVTATFIRNNLRLKITWMIMFPIILICVVGVALLLCILLIAPEAESATPDRDVLAGHLGLVLYASSLLTIGIVLNSMILQTVIREKSRGNITALLATPLRATDIWVGKSLAFFVPALLLGILLTVLSWVVVNVVYFLPDIGLIINPQMVINSLVAVPLMYLLFGLLVHLFGFIASPNTGNIIAQIFLPVMANLAAQLVARGVIEANSWQFMALNFGIAGVIGGFIIAFKPLLTPEQVILSG